MESAVLEGMPRTFRGVAGCSWFEEAERASSGIDVLAKGNFRCNRFIIVNFKADGVAPFIDGEAVWCWIARVV